MDQAATTARPHTLAGATILQIVPSLREEPTARAAVDVAYSLLQAGARALIAAGEGALVHELQGHGGEWIALAITSASPFARRRDVRLLEQLITAERVDIVHIHSVAAARCARTATEKTAVWFVATLPDVPVSASGMGSRSVDALAKADRILAPSVYAATPLMQRYGLAPERITIIPRSIDTARYDSAAIAPERIAALRAAWRIGPDERIVVVPGRVAPWNGQIVLPDAVRALVDGGLRDTVFALVGEDETQQRYARSVRKRAKALDVEALIRFTGHCPDLPAALAAADVVVLCATKPPLLGRLAAQAQAMARPVITTDVGILPEHVIAPPRMPEDLRTGWVVRAGDAGELAKALGLALSLDATAWRAMGARAREFADYMFSPQSVAAATRAVYTSLLARDR